MIIRQAAAMIGKLEGDKFLSHLCYGAPNAKAPDLLLDGSRGIEGGVAGPRLG